MFKSQQESIKSQNCPELITNLQKRINIDIFENYIVGVKENKKERKIQFIPTTYLILTSAHAYKVDFSIYSHVYLTKHDFAPNIPPIFSVSLLSRLICPL